MSLSIKLKDLVDELECQFDAYNLYFSKKIGRILLVWSEEYSAFIEEDRKNRSGGDEEKKGIAADILEHEADYIKLPSKSDINEDDMMEKFCLSRKSKKDSELLLTALKGRHAFLKFTNILKKLKITDEWERFRDEAYKEIAINWCHENKINFIE